MQYVKDGPVDERDKALLVLHLALKSPNWGTTLHRYTALRRECMSMPVGVRKAHLVLSEPCLDEFADWLLAHWHNLFSPESS